MVIQDRVKTDLTVSVTDIDGYKYFRENERLEFQEYLSRLRRIAPTHPRAMLGRQLHSALENFTRSGSAGMLNKYFNLKCEVELLRPDLTEMSATRVFRLPGDKLVRVNGRVDAICGLTVVDYKTASRIDLESYVGNFQWRAYLALLPEMETFRYDVFRLGYWPHKDGRYPILEHKDLVLRRYKNLEEDVQSMLLEYVEFLEQLKKDGWIDFKDGRVAR